MTPAHVVEAERHIEGGCVRRYFVESTRPGIWWRIDLIPHEPPACSCPAGSRMDATDPNAKLCRHLRGVLGRLRPRRWQWHRWPLHPKPHPG